MTVTPEQAHYLFSVMRLSAGDSLRVFDGVSGEWRAEVVEAGRRGGLVVARGQVGPQVAPPDLWLLFAPLKKARTDFVVEKAVELGAARIVPVLTEFTNAERVRVDRLQAHAVEAAEQCGATVVPEVAEPVKLGALLSGWDPGRRVMWADEGTVGAAVEGGRSSSLAALFAGERARDEARPGREAPERDAPAGGVGPWAILIGPEGGFSAAERKRLAALPFIVPVSLGPRILRAETAAVAALALWQARLGDWR